MMSWINKWLCDRMQLVRVNGDKSDWMPVSSEVPKGSGLGPIFFGIYINDLDCSMITFISKFVEDPKIGHIIKSDNASLKLQTEQKDLQEFAKKKG